MSNVGRENCYTCRQCGGHTVTVDRDEGVTPAFINCRASGREGDCRGVAESAGYPEAPRPKHIPEPQFEWRKYPDKMIEKLPLNQREHALRGGLFLVKIGSAERDLEGYWRDARGTVRRLK